MRTLPALLLATLAAAPGARAESIPADLVRGEIIGGWTTEDGTRMAALHLSLARGWKTYWRAPGDAGIPPSFDWTGSRNIGAIAFHWPTPDVFEVNGLTVIGYAGELVLPIAVTPSVPGEPVFAAARVELGVCETVCVPVTLDVRAELPPSGTGEPAIRAALADGPLSGRSAGVGRAVCAVEPLRDGLRLTMTLDLPQLGAGELAVIEVDRPGVWVSPAETRREGGRLVAVADLVPAEAQPFALDRSGITMTVLGGGRAVEVEGCTG